MLSRITTLMMLLTMALPNAVASPQVIPPAVPANLEVPAGHEPFLLLGAEGTQNYVCLSSTGGFAWTFFGPQATLFLGEASRLRPTFSVPILSTALHARPGSTPWTAARCGLP